ncbi:MAG TPA: pyridoxamine 5'-phosphate oxidase [Verrucomicrobiales bacterium]|nr:pyridoxamine 5'-phosphate oxidase [Verrucomicrobiales bacterium]
MDLSDIRRDYAERGIDRADLHDDPVVQFERWYQQACDAELLEPNAMSLATATPSGVPSLRTVLLKFFDHRGFVFFTNIDSRKARELASNPRASILFPWIPLERQVILCGPVERVSTAETLAYFLKRPFGSQTAAWASSQSQVISSRQLLEGKWEEMKRKFSEGQVPLPSFWGGFRLVPEEVEFWQGRKSRLHDRFRYLRGAAGAWQIDRLQP